METKKLLSTQDRIMIAGHKGMVGGAIWRTLTDLGFKQLIPGSRQQADFRDWNSTRDYVDGARPDVMVICAAKVGGIGANMTYPVEFLTDNLRIQLNLIEAAVHSGVRRVLFLASSCMYPKDCPQPMREEYLMSGPLEPTNESYALAKSVGVRHITSLRAEYSLPYISAVPTNIYGPGDNFDPDSSHVIPAMIVRYHLAKLQNKESVINWGTGTARREMMYVDDLADACVHLLANYDDDSPINVGSGAEVTMKELASRVATATGYSGVVEWDSSKADGMARKLVDGSRLASLGWKPKWDFETGLGSTYEWFMDSPWREKVEAFGS